MRSDAPSHQPPASLEDLVGEFVDRRLSGDAVSVDELCARHPDLADALRARLRAFEFLDAAVAPDRPPFAPGEVHGDYRIEALLGQGGMGLVYRATQISLARPVAVKVARPVTHSTWFRREARAAARVQHPHVVRVLAFEVLGAHPAIVMEHVTGESLSARLRRGAHDDVAVLVRHAIALADALRAIHEQDLLHGDLKPANVLITADDRALVSDFGLALLREEAGDARTDSWGTPAYTSPERLRGEPASVATDIHALGATLYAWFAGRPPHQGRDPAALRAAILHAPLVPLVTLRPDCPAAVAQIIERCLARDPASRPRTAAEVGAMLRRAARGAHAARRRKLIAALVATIVLLSGACAWLWHRSASERVATLVSQGELALQQGRFTAALTCFDRALAASPEPDGKLRFQRADAHIQELALRDESLPPARMRGLLAELDAAHAAGFSSAGLHYARAQFLRFLGDRAGADAAIALAGELPLVTAEDHFHRGGILSSGQDRAAAAASYREALRRQPGSVVCHHQLAYHLAAAGNADEALSVLEQGLRLYPDQDALLGLQASIWLRHGRAEEGLALLRELADRRPAPSASITHLLAHLRAQDRDAEAIEVLDALIADEPDKPRWRFERTAALIHARRIDAAEPELAELMATWSDDLLLKGLHVALLAHRTEFASAITELRDIAGRDGAPWTLATIADLCRPLCTPHPPPRSRDFFRLMGSLIDADRAATPSAR